MLAHPTAFHLSSNGYLEPALRPAAEEMDAVIATAGAWPPDLIANRAVQETTTCLALGATNLGLTGGPPGCRQRRPRSIPTAMASRTNVNALMTPFQLRPPTRIASNQRAAGY